MWWLETKNQIGDLILPIAAIRGEGTSNDYLPPEVPALPAFQLQRAVSTMIRDLGHDYWTGTVYTTNRRVWEHDDRFRDQLRRTRSMAIDMETATIFAAGFANHISTGALLLVSDQPMIPEGVKTEASDQTVTANYVERHIKIGIEALKLVRRQGRDWSYGFVILCHRILNLGLFGLPGELETRVFSEATACARTGQ
jgi:AMP nucleosidase